MGRVFKLAHDGRELEVHVCTVDEAWELWLFEKGCRLIMAAVVTIDDSLSAWRNHGADLIAETVRNIHERLEAGDIVLPGESLGKLAANVS
jgi:hypothetical protein